MNNQATSRKSTTQNPAQEKTTPEISIVIPVYNGEQFLRQTLDTIFHQTFQDFEVICVDDGSTDASPEILSHYAKEYPDKVRIITEKNSGPGVARNNGIKQAQGTYLALLDADDLYHPEMLQLAHDKIVQDRSDIVVYRSDEFSEEGHYFPTEWTINKSLLPKRQPFAGNDVEKNVFGVFIGWPWDKLYRTAFVKENNLKFQDLRSSEDALFVFMSIVRAERISVIDKVLVHHRNAAGSVSHTREGNWESCYKALTAMRKQLQDWHIYQRFEQDFVNYALNFTLWHLTTLTGDAYEQLFNKLKQSWWQELGINAHGDDADYFYDPWHYQLYGQVMSDTACSFQHFLRSTAEQTISIRDRELYDLHQSLTWKAGRIVMLPVRIARKLICKVLHKNPHQ